MNSPQILYENRYVTMYLDLSKNQPCIVKEWKGFAPKQDFKDILILLVDLILEQSKIHSNLRVIADSRKLKVLSPDVLEWLSTTIHPQYAQHGITKKAFIKPDDFFGNLSLEMYVKKSDKEEKIKIRVFKTLKEAKEWLFI